MGKEEEVWLEKGQIEKGRKDGYSINNVRDEAEERESCDG